MTSAARTPEVVEAGSPGQDLRGFRRALGHFATGVTIVTAQWEGQLAGMTANSFSSVSLDPPLVLFEKADGFAINVLAADQLDLASRFARSGLEKFAGVEWRPGVCGAPCLPGTSATFECRKHSVIDAGDHYILLGKVERYQRADHDPLLFAHGRFGLSVDYPVIATGIAGGATPASSSSDQPTMLGLLWDAFTGMSHSFQAERDALGLSVSQGRVLSLIERYPGAQAEMVARKAYVSPQGLDDVVLALVAAGFLTVGPDGSWSLTASGRDNVALRRRRAAAIEASQLKAFSAAELEATCKVLRALGSERPAASTRSAS
jgi:flavin reductase (DIM6/NTAB) family NADH-FMN oxidoreductase RutF/DNA-binding MarR family transcriptional regulator